MILLTYNAKNFLEVDKLKIVVTGGGGFIGSHLVRQLLAHNHNVHMIDLNPGPFTDKKKNLYVYKTDIRSKDAKKIILREKPDFVYHLAAQADVTSSVRNPAHDADININGTINILEACRDAKVKKIIFASTSAVYGQTGKPLIHETDITMPASFYGLSKLTAEKYIDLFAKLYRLKYTILRYGNVYGPGQTPKGEGGVIAVFLNRLKKGDPLSIHGDGEQTRDFIYVSDVVKANVRAMERGDNEIFHISKGKGTSINQIVHILKEIHPLPVSVRYTTPRPGDIKHSCLNSQKAEKSLLWKAEVDIKEGIKKTYRSVFHEQKPA